MRGSKTLKLVPSLLIVFVLTALGITSGVSAATNQHSSRYVIHYPMRSLADSRKLAKFLLRNGFDIAGLNLHKNEVEVIASDAQIKFLESKGLQGHVIKKRLSAEDSEKIDSRYLDPEKVAQKLKALHEAFP